MCDRKKCIIEPEITLHSIVRMDCIYGYENNHKPLPRILTFSIIVVLLILSILVNIIMNLHLKVEKLHCHFEVNIPFPYERGWVTSIGFISITLLRMNQNQPNFRYSKFNR